MPYRKSGDWGVGVATAPLLFVLDYSQLSLSSIVIKVTTATALNTQLFSHLVLYIVKSRSLNLASDLSGISPSTHLDHAGNSPKSCL